MCLIIGLFGRVEQFGIALAKHTVWRSLAILGESCLGFPRVVFGQNRIRIENKAYGRVNLCVNPVWPIWRSNTKGSIRSELAVLK